MSKVAKMSVELLAVTPHAEKIIELAGRTAYKSFEKITDASAGEFIGRIVRNGHESVLEHASASIRVKGISRACSHQIVRHRLASYTQSSQRYVDESGAEFVVPPSIAQCEAYRDLYMRHLTLVGEMYECLKKAGIPSEDARFVLPNACATEIVMSANFREWRHFLTVCGDPHAQWEIRELALQVYEILSKEAPSVFADFSVVAHPKNGLCLVKSKGE